MRKSPKLFVETKHHQSCWWAMDRLVAKMDASVAASDWKGFRSYLAILKARSESQPVKVVWLSQSKAGKKLVKWRAKAPPDLSLPLLRVIQLWKDQAAADLAAHKEAKKTSKTNQTHHNEQEEIETQIKKTTSLKRLQIKATQNATSKRRLARSSSALPILSSSSSSSSSTTTAQQQSIPSSLYEYCTELLCQKRKVPQVDPFLMPEEAFTRLIRNYNEFQMMQMQRMNPLLCRLHHKEANIQWGLIIRRTLKPSLEVNQTSPLDYWKMYNTLVRERAERQSKQLASAQQRKEKNEIQKQVGGTVMVPASMARKRMMRKKSNTRKPTLMKRRSKSSSNTWKKLKRR